MSASYFLPIPDADPNKDWSGIENWATSVDIQARELGSLQSCYDALHFAPYGPGSRLGDEIGAWLSNNISNIQHTEFSGWSHGEKRLRTVLSPGFFAAITQRWGSAFNIPANSEKFQNILYNIAKHKMSGLKKKSSRKAQPSSSATMPASLVQTPLPPRREPEANTEIEFVDNSGEAIGSVIVRFLRNDDVSPDDACFETVSLVKFLNFVEDMCDVDPKSFVFRHHYPSIPELDARIIRTRQTMLATELWRAYSHRDHQGPIVIRLEPRQQDPTNRPPPKRPASPSLSTDPTSKRQRPG
jgi:hypothetical protein